MQPSPPPSPRPRGQIALIVCALLATFAYYFWTGRVFFDPPPTISGAQDDHFNLLARGFRKGHLYLDREVPPALIASRNPYDPKERIGIGIPHDASYYKGRYYVYFGPAPAVTLFLPFSVLTGHDLPAAHGVLVYCFLGYAALTAIFLFLQRRYHPTIGLSSLAVCLVVLGGATMMTGLLRRPYFWEVSCSAGFCFFTWALYCLVRALHSERAIRWTLLGGLALGLAVASRPTYIVCSPLFALPLLFRPRRREDGSAQYGWSELWGAAVPCTLIVLGLLAYNYARFGNFLEFGQRYQLSSIIEGEARHFSLNYLGYNLYIYGYSWLRWTGAFPFIHPVALPPEPEGFGDHEFTFGLFTNLPFSLFALAIVAGLGWRLVRRQAGDARWLSIAVLFGASVLTFAPLSIFFGSCIRYMTDFVPCVMLLACLGFLELGARLKGVALPRLLRGCGWSFAVFSVVVAALSVVNAYDVIPETPPVRYTAVAETLNAPFHAIDQVRYPERNPWNLELTFPEDRTPRTEPLLVVHKWAAPSAVLFVEYLDGEWVRFGYHEPAAGTKPVYSAMVLARSGEPHQVRVSFADPGAPLLHGTKSFLRVHFDGRGIWESPAVSPAGYPGRIVAGEASPEARAGLRFTGKLTAAPATDPAAPAASRPPQGTRIRFHPTAALRNRSFPLLVTGVKHTGDVLFVRVSATDELIFGYDHWGQPSQSSAPLPIKLDRDYAIEFWHPAFAPRSIDKPKLLVKVNGAVAWEAEVAHYPFTPAQIHFGYNPIGGTASERTFDEGVIETTELPFQPRDAAAAPRGARLRVRLTPAMRGRGLPLATTGITGQGDVLFLRLSADDQLTLGYDHWAAPCLNSAPIRVSLYRDMVIDFWLPALAPAPGPTAPLHVKIDGAEVWRQEASFYPTTPAQVFFGYNPLGGTSAEAIFDGAVVLDTNLPYSLEK